MTPQDYAEFVLQVADLAETLTGQDRADLLILHEDEDDQRITSAAYPDVFDIADTDDIEVAQAAAFRLLCRLPHDNPVEAEEVPASAPQVGDIVLTPDTHGYTVHFVQDPPTIAGACPAPPSRYPNYQEAWVWAMREFALARQQGRDPRFWIGDNEGNLTDQTGLADLYTKG